MAIAFDVAATGCGSGTTIDITGPNVGGSDRVLIVGVAQGNSAVVLTSVTWDQGGTNQAMTKIAEQSNSGDARIEMYRLVAPTTGVKTLRIVSPSSIGVAVGIVNRVGVDQDTRPESPIATARHLEAVDDLEPRAAVVDEGLVCRADVSGSIDGQVRARLRGDGVRLRILDYPTRTSENVVPIERGAIDRSVFLSVAA